MYFLIPISFLFVALAIGLYIWAVHSGQYDDLDVEGQRILFDQDRPTTAQPATNQSPTADTTEPPASTKTDHEAP
jgi:cbb3-type cytochrome oxidase maturation protein